MLGASGVCGDEGQVDGRTGHARQLDLGLFSGLFDTLHGHLVAGKVNALLHLEAREDPVHDPLVEVVAAQTVVTGSGQHFLHAVAHFDDGHVEGAAAQVVHHNFLVVILIYAVGQGCGSGLVDDTLYFQASDLASVLGGLALGVGEVCGHGDHRAGDGLTQIGLCIRLQLLQNHSGNFLRRIALAVDGHFIVGTHFTLDRRNRALRVGDGLTLCHLAHHTLAGLGEGHHRGSGPSAFRVGDHYGLAAFNHGHTRVCSTQVNANSLCHNKLPSFVRKNISIQCMSNFLDGRF